MNNTVYFRSLGCDKNLVDSEKMLGELAQAGYNFTEDENTADIAIVNTCCFVKDAQMESVEVLLSLADKKKSGQLKCLVITGCMAQRYQKDIFEEIPEVDAVLGTTAREDLLTVLRQVSEERKAPVLDVKPLDLPEQGGQRRIRTSGGGTGYLKIAEGCSKCCTYCAIPGFRGPYRSVPMDDLLAEAQQIADQGVTELILVAQETTVYGVDLYGEKKLPELLEKLCLIEGIHWIRILYCYPEEINEELIDVMAREPKILHYLDMPVQHASDTVLRRMGRRTSKAELEGTVARLRERIPDICLRTTLITGFPGETEEEHEELLEFVRKQKFDRLGVFTYSKEDGTPAARLKPQILQKVKKRRQKELMLAQQKVAFAKAAKQKGRVLDAVIEGRLADEVTESGAFIYTARTYLDAPDIDGLLFIESGKELMSGEYVSVKITGSEGYDLIGKQVIAERS